MPGRISTKWSLTILVPARRQAIRISSPSTAAFGTNIPDAGRICLNIGLRGRFTDLHPDKVNHMKREKMTKREKGKGGRQEEEQLHIGADWLCAEAGGVGHAVIGGMQDARGLRSRRYTIRRANTARCSERHETAHATRRRERPAEEKGGESMSG